MAAGESFSFKNLKCLKVFPSSPSVMGLNVFAAVFRMRSRLGRYRLFVRYKNCLIPPFITSFCIRVFNILLRLTPHQGAFMQHSIQNRCSYSNRIRSRFVYSAFMCFMVFRFISNKTLKYWVTDADSKGNSVKPIYLYLWPKSTFQFLTRPTIYSLWFHWIIWRKINDISYIFFVICSIYVLYIM